MTVRAVPAVSRAIAILRLLGHARAPMGVKAIAEALELVPSTALHILRVLVAEELVKVDAGKQYTLGMGTLALARASLESNDFPTRVQPHLDSLSCHYGVTAIGLELPNLEHMIVVALSRAQTPVRLHVDVGSRFPALISATGRCVAAFSGAPWSDIRKRFEALRWDAPPTLATWREEVGATRVNGYAIDDGQYIRGVSIVAAPVMMPDGTINAVVMVGLREHMERAGLTALGEELHRRALRISHILGGKEVVAASPRGRPRIG